MSQATKASRVDVELWLEVRNFYARQMRVLDELDVDNFTLTFTEDGGVSHPHRNESVRGRENMRAKMRSMLPQYDGLVTRHWFDHFLIDERADGTLRVTYYSLVTQADDTETVRFFSSSSVEDIMVREDDGELRIRDRVILRDNPKHGTIDNPKI